MQSVVNLLFCSEQVDSKLAPFELEAEGWGTRPGAQNEFCAPKPAFVVSSNAGQASVRYLRVFFSVFYRRIL